MHMPPGNAHLPTRKFSTYARNSFRGILLFENERWNIFAKCVHAFWRQLRYSNHTFNNLPGLFVIIHGCEIMDQFLNINQ